MGFLFGRLTEQFVSFGSAQSAYYQDPNNATVLQELEIAAAQFRSSAALNASYLVYIGTSLPLPPSTHSSSQRNRCPCLHILLHERLGLHWRSKCQTHS